MQSLKRSKRNISLHALNREPDCNKSNKNSKRYKDNITKPESSTFSNKIVEVPTQITSTDLKLLQSICRLRLVYPRCFKTTDPNDLQKKELDFDEQTVTLRETKRQMIELQVKDINPPPFEGTNYTIERGCRSARRGQGNASYPISPSPSPSKTSTITENTNQ